MYGYLVRWLAVSVMRVRRSVLAAGLLAVLVTLACGRRPADPAMLIAVCGTLRVTTAADAATPVFAWDPACPAVQLSVHRDGGIIWALDSHGGLKPPVRYGAAPAGSVTQIGPATLQRGVAHSARLGYEESAQSLILAAPVSFVP